MPRKKKIPSYNELVDKVMALCPNASFKEDDDGQVVIETGYAQPSDEDEPLEPLSEIDEDALDAEDDDEDDDDDLEDEDDCD
jgi:hypothetical protein